MFNNKRAQARFFSFLQNLKFSGKIFSQCLLFKNVFDPGNFLIYYVILFLKMRFLYGKIFWKVDFDIWIW